MKLRICFITIMLVVVSFVFAVKGVSFESNNNQVIINYNANSEESFLVRIPNTGKVEVNWKVEFENGSIASGMGDSQLFLISTPAIYRDLRVVSVKINKNETIKQLTIALNIDRDVPGTNEKINCKTVSRSFNEIYDNTVINYTPERNLSKDRILYFYPEEVEEYVTELGNWKLRTGFEVEYYPLTAETNTTAWIYNEILQAYNTFNPPSFVVLFGDVNGNYHLPTHWYDYPTGTAEGDHPYATLEGNDIVEDIAIGRVSFSTTSELSTIIHKIKLYEGMQNVPLGWQNRVLLVSDTDESGISTYTTNQYVKEIMSNYNNDFAFTELVGTSPSPSLMTSNLNVGVSFFNYRGFLGMSGWDAYEANTLLNGPRLPIVTTITCDTGSFGIGLSRTEAFLRAGTPQLPAGAIASIGCSTADTHTCYNNLVDASIYEGLFVHDIKTIGEALLYAKNQLFTVYGASQPEVLPYNYQIFNLMGDPSTVVVKGNPSIFTVDTSGFDGTGSLPCSINGLNGQEYFYSLWSDTNGMIASGFSSATDINLPIGIDSESIKLLITSEGYKPVEQIINVNNEVGFGNPVVSIQTQGISTEFIYPNTASSVNVTCNSRGVNPGVYPVSYYIINSDGETIRTNEAQLDVNADNTSGLNQPIIIPAINKRDLSSGLKLRLVINANDSTAIEVDLPAYSSDLKVTHEFSYTKTEEMVLGETSELMVRLENERPNDYTVDWSNTYIEGAPLLSNIDLNDESVLQYYTFHCDADLDINIQHYIPITVNLSMNNGITLFWIDYIEFNVIYGGSDNPYRDNTGRYSIFTNSMRNTPELMSNNWIELNPELGGNGELTEISDEIEEDDDVITRDLPFEFNWYNQAFSQVSICSNGWISMGSTDQFIARNWRFPGPLGPSNMIAPFWDDLITTNGGVYTYNDVSNDRYIVQWDCYTLFDNTPEKFQLHLYGSGEILFIYNDVTAVDDNYEFQHGSYFTTGFEGNDSTCGFEYAFGNNYKPEYQIIEDGMKILIQDSDTSFSNAFLPIVNYSYSLHPNETKEFIFPICSLVGTVNADFEISSIQNWLTFSDETSLEVSEGSRSEIGLTINTNGLAEGSYVSWLLISSSDKSLNGRDIPVSLEIRDSATPSLYRISSFPYIDYTNDTQIGLMNYSGFINIGDYFEGTVTSYLIEANPMPIVPFLLIEEGVINFTEEVKSNYELTITANSGENNVNGMLHIRAFENVGDSENTQTIDKLNLTNYPNPFNPSTTISFTLDKQDNVELSIYNLKGQRISTLTDRILTEGNHTVNWNGIDKQNRQVTSGVYFVRLKTSNLEMTRKIILIK